jgi:hypothetical protein
MGIQWETHCPVELAVPHKVRAHWRRAVNKVDRVAIKADVAHLHV